VKTLFILLSFIAITSVSFAQAKTLKCTDENEITVIVELQGSKIVKAFSIDEFGPDLGRFTTADMVSYDGNAMGSQRYEKQSKFEGQTVTEAARFGIQQIGSVKTAYLSFKSEATGPELETMLVCK